MKHADIRNVRGDLLDALVTFRLNEYEVRMSTIGRNSGAITGNVTVYKNGFNKYSADTVQECIEWIYKN